MLMHQIIQIAKIPASTRESSWSLTPNLRWWERSRETWSIRKNNNKYKMIKNWHEQSNYSTGMLKYSLLQLTYVQGREKPQHIVEL